MKKGIGLDQSQILENNLYFPKLKKNFFFDHTACGILLPWPGIEPRAPEVKVPSPKHGTQGIPHFLNCDVAKLGVSWEEAKRFQLIGSSG